MWLVRVTFALVPALVGLGCTKGSPGFTVLDQGAIPQPMFDGQTTKTLARPTAGETTAITGQCDARIRAINVNLIGYRGKTGALGVISSGTPTVACDSAGTFSFTLQSLTDLVGPPVANETYRIELRADTAGGMSNASVLFITYTRESWERWRLSEGATENVGHGPRLATSSGFKADLRVSHLVGADDTNHDSLTGVARSSHFILKQGRAAR